jgi:hypothetical protein
MRRTDKQCFETEGYDDENFAFGCGNSGDPTNSGVKVMVWTALQLEV